MQLFEYVTNFFRKFWNVTNISGPNYKFHRCSEPKPIFTTNQRNVETTQKVILHALKQHLFGYDYEYIVNGFYMPEVTNDLVLTAIQRGNLPDHSIPKDIHYYRARSRALELLRPPWLARPVHFADLPHYPWNWTPSAEAPFSDEQRYADYLKQLYDAGEIDNQHRNFGNLKNIMFTENRVLVHDIKRRKNLDPDNLPHQYPMNIHIKPQLTKTGNPPKLRIIYGYPKLPVMVEAMFFWPIINYHKYAPRHLTPLLWPYVTFLGGMYRLNHDLTIRNLFFKTYVTVDWSGFDLHALFSMIKDLQSDWRTMFTFEHGYIPVKKPGITGTLDYSTTSSDPTRLQNLWDWMCATQLATPFRMPDGSQWYRLHRGIPSGLFLTQWLDSHYNLVMLLTILDRMGFDISNLFIKVQGDDSITAFRIYIPSNQHAEFQAQFSALAVFYFSAVSRLEKTEITNDSNGVQVLGYRNYNGQPDRDWRQLLAQLLYSKSRSPTFSTLMARCIGITYADCDRHPIVRTVCKDIYDYLSSLGHKPEASGFQYVPFTFEDLTKDMDFTTFPSKLDVTKHLNSFSQFTQENRRRYWPDIFLTDH
jgi:hypothetical protein